MSRFVPSSLTGRLIATVVAFVAVVSVLIAVTTTVVLRSYLIDKLDSDVERSLGRVQMAIGKDGPGGGPGPGGGFPGPQGNREVSITALFADGSSEGTNIDRSGDEQTLGIKALAALEDVEPRRSPQTVDVPGYGSFRVAAAQTPDGSVAVQGLPTTGVDDTIETLILWELALAALGTATAAIAGRALVRRQLKPLRQVAATAHEVTTFDLASGEVGETTRVPADLTDPTTEVGKVGDALNQLLGHVEGALAARHDSEQQARQFLADASHELRTPLSTIKGYTELVRRVRMSDADDLAQVLAKVESEAGRMTSLVEDMFLLARLDAGRDLQRSPVDLVRVVLDAVQDATVVDPDRTWISDLPSEPVVISGDEQRLHQLVTNLLRNGTGHTPVGTTVTAAVQVEDGAAVLTVTDDGPGIDSALLPTIFDRFARGDSSRTRASGGAGLGTSLVRAIAHAHGGRATVASRPGRTQFRITLP